MQGALGDGDLMLICIAPDEEGKFGFNVKVGLSLVSLLPSPHKAKFYVLFFYTHYVCHSFALAPFNFPTTHRVEWIRRCL